MVAAQRDLHVFDHGHRAERRGHLKCPADAQSPDVARPHTYYAAVAETHVPAIGRQLAVDHVEAGRFASAVRADQRQEFAVTDLEAHAVHRADAPE